jgi:hypothetical protein
MHQFVTVVGQTSPAIYDLTTIADVNDALALASSPTNDAAVAADITASSRQLADLCGRVFALQTVVETFRFRFGADSYFDRLNLSRYPVTEFQSLSINDQVIDPTFYEIDFNSGVVYLLYGIWTVPSYWSIYPGAGKMVANYSGGYMLPDDAPGALAAACIENVRDGRMLTARGLHAGLQDVWSGDNRIRYFDFETKTGAGVHITGVSARVEGFLAPFRRFAV